MNKRREIVLSKRLEKKRETLTVKKENQKRKLFCWYIKNIKSDQMN